MKLSILALLSVLVITACSDSGSGGGGVKPVRPEDFNPKVMPSNPASKQYIQEMLSSLRLAKKIHPEDAAIFSSIIEAGEERVVDQGMRNEAFSKLSSEGMDLLSRINANCRLNPGKKDKIGSEKSTITEKTSISSDGVNCNYVIQKNTEQVTQHGPVSEDKNSGVISGSATIRGSVKSLRELRDPVAQGFARLVSTSSEDTLTGNMNFRFGTKTPDQYMEAQASSTGVLTIKLTGGESIQGPTYSWTNIKSAMNASGVVTESVDVRIKFDGKSPQGDIVLIILATEKGTQTYLNGEEVDPGSVGTMLSVQNPVRQLLGMVRQAR